MLGDVSLCHRVRSFKESRRHAARPPGEKAAGIIQTGKKCGCRNRKPHPFPEFEPHFLARRQTLQSPATPLLASLPGKHARATASTHDTHTYYIYYICNKKDHLPHPDNATRTWPSCSGGAPSRFIHVHGPDGGACPSSKSSSSQEPHCRCVHWSEPQSLLLLLPTPSVPKYKSS